MNVICRRLFMHATAHQQQVCSIVVDPTSACGPAASMMGRRFLPQQLSGAGLALSPAPLDTLQPLPGRASGGLPFPGRAPGGFGGGARFLPGRAPDGHRREDWLGFNWLGFYHGVGFYSALGFYHRPVLLLTIVRGVVPRVPVAFGVGRRHVDETFDHGGSIGADVLGYHLLRGRGHGCRGGGCCCRIWFTTLRLCRRHPRLLDRAPGRGRAPKRPPVRCVPRRLPLRPVSVFERPPHGQCDDPPRRAQAAVSEGFFHGPKHADGKRGAAARIVHAVDNVTAWPRAGGGRGAAPGLLGRRGIARAARGSLLRAEHVGRAGFCRPPAAAVLWNRLRRGRRLSPTGRCSFRGRCLVRRRSR
mmetsp:Transcript_17662/g.35190  ORF Transcript_17662/g.35190 Transcript_17662/m.35190 type:complete len:359 (-) Transcript_17662:18-1094(-)